MIPLADARRLVLSAVAPAPPVRLPLGEALGSVAAERVVADGPVPPFENSQMDGYALVAADTAAGGARLRVVGSVMAGQVGGMTVGSGEAVRIMTGAPIPAGADAVCMVERTTTEDDGSVVVHGSVEPGEYVRRAGEDIAAGEVVIRPGTVLGPSQLGVLASLGKGAVLVHRRPRVGVLSTGDELVPLGERLRPGQVRDANRPALLALVRASGFPAVDLGIVADDEARLAEALTGAATACDVVVTSGGVSVGDRDYVKVVLDKLTDGQMRWMQVAIKPAKPFAFGVLAASGTPVFGLPGNPVSSLVSFELFVRPALRRIAGHRQLDRPAVDAVADEDLGRALDGKLHLARVCARFDTDGRVHVRSSGRQASHLLRAMAEANALALLPDGEGVRRGARVRVMLLDADGLAPAGEEGAP